MAPATFHAPTSPFRQWRTGCKSTKTDSLRGLGVPWFSSLNPLSRTPTIELAVVSFNMNYVVKPDPDGSVDYRKVPTDDLLMHQVIRLTEGGTNMRVCYQCITMSRIIELTVWFPCNRATIGTGSMISQLEECRSDTTIGTTSKLLFFMDLCCD